MEAETESLTGRLRPFWGRIMVIPSDLGEETRPSGLIHPFIGEHSPVKRGIVAHVDRLTLGEPSESMEDIHPGTVVYYVEGLRVLDAVMLMRHEIVGYEVAE